MKPVVTNAEGFAVVPYRHLFDCEVDKDGYVPAQTTDVEGRATHDGAVRFKYVKRANAAEAAPK